VDQFPDHRRYSVDVGAGDEEIVRFGDPLAWGGWVLRWMTTQTVNFAKVIASIHARSPFWYQNRQLEWGDSNDGSPEFTQGGILYVPYPWVEIGFADAENVGGINIEITGQPLPCGAVTRAGMTMQGSTPWETPASDHTEITIPLNACGYVVTLGSFDASSVTVEAKGLDGETFEMYELSQDNAPPGTISPMPWRQTPPMNADGQGEIRLENNDGANATEGRVYFLYDLSRGQ
jgi:hypothetical protein